MPAPNIVSVCCVVAGLLLRFFAGAWAVKDDSDFLPSKSAMRFLDLQATCRAAVFLAKLKEATRALV